MSLVPASFTCRVRAVLFAFTTAALLVGAWVVPARSAEREVRGGHVPESVAAPDEPQPVPIVSSFPAVSDGDVLLWRRSDGATLRVRPEGLWLRRTDGSLEALAAPSLVERGTDPDGAIVYSGLYPGVTEAWTVTGDDVRHEVTLERWPAGAELLEGEALVITWLAENSRLPGPWLPDASVPFDAQPTVIDDLTSSADGELSLHSSQQQVGELTRLLTELWLDTPTVANDEFPIVISPTAVAIAFLEADSPGLRGYKACLSGEEDTELRVLTFMPQLSEDVLPPLPMAFPAPCSPADGTFTNFPGNDDLSVGPVALGFTFSLYGTPYTSAYVNNNGNLTFASAFGAFTASGFPLAGVPMVAPFWGDVDTRTGNTVKYKAIAPNTFVATFENVGYYATHLDKLNTFQVIISDGTNPAMGIGKNVCFCYDDMQWTTGDASGGVGGFGGTPATVGVNGGNGVDYVQVGRFGMPGGAYDGPFGATDGIDYLDGRTECFRVDLPPLVCTAGTVTINGCGSATVSGATVTDINGSAVSWNWTSSNANLSVSPASGSLPAGPTGPQALPAFAVTSSGAACIQAGTLTLHVTDALGALSQCTTMVSLTNDGTAPVVNCPADTVVECDGAGNTAQFQAFQDSFTATDNCGTPTTMTTVAPGIVSGFLTYSNFSDLSGLQLNGATAAIHTCVPPPCEPVSFGGQDVLRLTNDFNQGGSAFTTTTLSLAADASFSTFFAFQITDPGGISDSDGQGADGFVFAVQTASNLAGGLGVGIGFSGIPNSVGVEFDTWDNGGIDGSNGNHLGIDINGNVNSAVRQNIATRFNNGAVQYGWVDYNGATDTLEVRHSTSPTRPLAANLTYNVDLVAVLGSTNAYLGFTSGTGSAWNDHDIRQWVVNTSFNPIGCSGTGVQTVTFKATDACNNMAQCMRTFTIVDTVPPVLMGCPAPTVAVSCPSQVPAPPTVTATDACDSSVSVVASGDVIAGNVPCNYTVTRTWMATDDCGNSTSCTQVVTVQDTTGPVITCPAPVTVQCATAVPAPAPGSVMATDNCAPAPVVTHVGDATVNQTCANRFTVQRTYRATDACGNSADCVQLITVNDTTAPAITCPAPVTVQCATAVPAPAPGSVMATDNCAPAPVVTHVGDATVNQTCANRFTVQRTYRATDACGNSADCVQLITVNDTTAPAITCPAPVTVQCAAAVPAATPGSVVATDNCAPAPVVTHVGDVTVSQTCANQFTVQRTYRATDACGNSVDCVQLITVNDTTVPAITCPAPVTVQCAAAVPAPAPGSIVATDNCAPAPVVTHVGDVTVNQTCANQFTVQRTYRATDACGNSADCVQLITVNDTTAPAITCPAPLTVQCAAAVPAATPGSVVTTDNCAPPPVVTHVGDVTVNQTCANQFTVQRTYRATDACGNSADCVQLITVNDTTPPVITCPASLTFQCAVDVPLPNIALVSATDNCAPAPTVTHVGDVVANQTCVDRFTVQRTYRATDACGNSADCVQSIVVDDTTAPVPAAALVPLPPAPPISAASPAVPQAPGSACSAPTSGTFTVSCAGTDNCDPNPALAAVLVVTNHDVLVQGGPCVLRVERLDVACGELVEIRLVAPPCPARPPGSPQQASEVRSDGVRVFSGESVVLEVTATDRCGNAAAATADPTTPPPAPCDDPLLDGSCCPAIEPPAPPNCQGGPCP